MATFSVSDNLRRVQHTGTGGAGPFAFAFQVDAQGDVRVLVDATQKTLTTHYTVSIATGGNGTISFTSGNEPTTAQKITIMGKTPLARTSVYSTGGTLTAASLESDFDSELMRLQQLQEESKRSIQLPPETQRVLTGADGTTTGPLQFPYSNTVADNASKVVAYDTNGTALTATQELGEFQGNWAASTAYVLRDIVKDTNNNNIYICVTAHTSSGSVPLSSNTDSAKWSLIVNAASATTSQTAAATSAQLADDWAVKTSGVVESSEYSSKAYAVGGTGVTTSSGKGAAKEWATTTGGAVDTSEYSAKEYAVGTTVAVGSAKDWATITGAAVHSSEYSAKEYAIGTTVAVGSAKDWALQAEDSAVTGSSYSALHHAAKGAASATAAASSATGAASSASTATTQATAAAASATAAAASADAFDDAYLGAKSSAPTVDNDGDALTAGDLYFNTSTNVMNVWTGSAWIAAALSGAAVVEKTAATGSGVIPTGTTVQRDGSPVVGYFRYNSTTNQFEGYSGSSPAWGEIGGAGGGYFKGDNGTIGTGAGDIFRINEAELNTSTTILAAENASATGPLSIASGVTLTVAGVLAII